jgi:hypothetical protein
MRKIRHAFDGSPCAGLLQRVVQPELQTARTLTGHLKTSNATFTADNISGAITLAAQHRTAAVGAREGLHRSVLGRDWLKWS